MQKNKIWEVRFILTKQLLVSKNQNQISIMMFLSSITILVWPKYTDTDLDFLSQVAKHLFSFISLYLCVCILTKGIWLQEEQSYYPNPNTNPSIDFTGSWISTLVSRFKRECPELNYQFFIQLSLKTINSFHQLQLLLDLGLKHKFCLIGHMEAILLSVFQSQEGTRI